MYAYDRGDLKAAVEAVDDGSEYWRKEKISYDAAYGNERVPAYLFLPKLVSPPFQTVIFFPGAWATRLRSSNDLFVSYMDFIIRSGRALLHPIYKDTFERHVDIISPGPNFSRDRMIWWAKDLSRSLDYLETRPEIDGKKLAYYGFSMGAGVGPVLTAIEGRFKTSVLVAGGMGQSKPLPEVDAFNFAPRARIPVLMLNGRHDYAFPLETSQIPLFRLLGAPENDKQHIVVESGHAPPRQAMIKEILDWLDGYLGPVSLK
jgi:dienelactone hydrolase